MATTTIDLSGPQASALRSLADQTGKPESELIREAIDQFLADAGVEVAPDAPGAPATDWKSAWAQAAGMWKDRTDLDDLMVELRRESDRIQPPDEHE